MIKKLCRLTLITLCSVTLISCGEADTETSVSPSDVSVVESSTASITDDDITEKNSTTNEDSEHIDSVDSVAEESNTSEIEENIEDANNSPFSNLVKGQYVTFGSYEQDNNLNNGQEPIEWEILSVEEDRILLISRYVLDCVQYNTEYTDVTWETCTLRSWLNNDFYNTAFTDDEKDKIMLSMLENPDHHIWSRSEGGNNTEDYVFCLSETEIYNLYRDRYSSWDEAHKSGFCEDLIIEPTSYAYRMEEYMTIHTFMDGDVGYRGYSENIIGKTGTYWYTRTPGGSNDSVTVVGWDGKAFTGDFVHDFSGVRPAIYVKF